MLNRIDVVEPPNSAPQYIDDSTMMPAIGSMPNVSGSSRATPFGAPRPGSTPTRMPSSTPPAMSARWYGVRAVPNPSMSGPRSIIGGRSEAERGFERSFGERHAEPQIENRVEHRHRHDAEHRRRQPPVPAVPAHHEREKQARRHVAAEHHGA